jgi:hypothetical protein
LKWFKITTYDRPSVAAANHSTCSTPEGGGGGGRMGAAESKTTTFKQTVARLDLRGGLLEQLTSENVSSVQVNKYKFIL